MPKDFNVKFGKVSDDVAADVTKVWRSDVKETHTLASNVSSADTSITLGQISTIKAGDAIFVDDELMFATDVPGGESNSVVPVQRPQPVDHTAPGTVTVLLYSDPFQPLGPLVRDYLISRIQTLKEKSTVFHVEMSGTITDSTS